MKRIIHSNFGLALRGIRDNPKRMAALGFNVQLHRYVAIVLSGAFAGVAGIMNTYYTGVISPSRAGLSQSVLVVMAALLGGVDRLEGGILGGLCMAFLLSVTNEFTERYWSVIGVLLSSSSVSCPTGFWYFCRGSRSKARAQQGRIRESPPPIASSAI